MNGKRLCKSSTNRMICGVCGGIAEYFNIDVTIVRLIAVVLLVCGSSGFWIYLIAALIMPQED